MKTRHFRLIAITCIAILLSACFGPESPQEVTQAFWQATIDGDNRKAADYSTLASPRDYDGFSRDWADYRVSWGKVVIDGDEASIAGSFAGDGHSRNFTTYLVRRDDTWLVDYERTNRSINGGVFGDLFNSLDRLGADFSEHFNTSAEEANAQLEQMLEQLGDVQQQLDEQATEALQEYEDELREALRQMDESIHQSLEENKEKQSSGDRQPPEPYQSI